MNSHPPARSVEILLIEDNPADVRLTQEALLERKVTNRLWVAYDGEEAMDFLFRRGRHGAAPRPDLILLDLNLPKKDGREVLAEIKNDPALRTIPVVVLTTSKAEEDVFRAYELQCSCYITKPVDFERFTDVVQRIDDFWLTVVTLPPPALGLLEPARRRSEP